MLFAVLLALHSWCRWIVVGLTLLVVLRCASGWLRAATWTSLDAGLARAWVGAVDLQVSIGLLLYFTASPTAAAARQSLRVAWTDGWLRFFGIVHPAAMLSAAALAHAAWVWARRTEDHRFRRLGLGALGALTLIALAIPWPFLPYGRPLARV